MFGPWIEIFTWAKGLLPNWSGFKWPRPRFNFIILHYVYLIALTLIGSVILYGSKNMAYIDALFFASGAATQSGLNTINVNDIYLYQQIALYLIACIANPIFINTFVVFVRLYWFEKRFQKVVLEAQKQRRSRDKFHTLSRAKANPDVDQEERGVGNRKIVVMHRGSGITKDITHHDSSSEEHEEQQSSDQSELEAQTAPKIATNTNSSSEDPVTVPTPRGITFADEVKPPRRQDTDRFSAYAGQDKHIQILENQRNPRDKGTLYIPGPRDFDRGHVPQRLSEEDGPGLSHARSVEIGLNAPVEKWHRPLSRGDPTDKVPLRRRHFGGVSFEEASQAVNQAKRRLKDTFGIDEPAAEESAIDTSGYDTTPHVGLRKKGRTSTFTSFMTTSEADRSMPYLSYQPTLGRNSAFVNLTEAQREELGGIEYRALKTLAVVLCCYFIGFHVLGLLSLTPWIVQSRQWGTIVDSDGINRAWWGIFTSASMFNDLGFTLTPDSMASFQYAVWPLLMGSFLIIIGNTGFPCMLRVVIWILSKFMPKDTTMWEELRFLLDHPRRCFTLLFPSSATWWLFWVLVILNGLDLIFFIILDLNDDTVTVLPSGIRVLDGWFQAASTRTAGFGVVNIANLHPAIQVSYLIMMYISVFPIAISVRRTNVYEEKSLGLYGGGDDEGEEASSQSYVGAHLRRQLSFDLWYVFLGLFIITIVEGPRISNTNEYAFTTFSILFEVVSAYGTVGLSLGYPGIDASFSAEFKVLSKLVIIAMQIRGRHRGLPYALDRAILLPSENLQHKEEEDAVRRLAATQRRTSNASQVEKPDFGPRATPEGHMPQLNRSQHSTQNSLGRQKHPQHGLTKLLSQAMGAGPARHEID